MRKYKCIKKWVRTNFLSREDFTFEVGSLWELKNVNGDQQKQVLLKGTDKTGSSVVIAVRIDKLRENFELVKES